MRFWQSRSVFVTGGTGLLGSWLIPMLLQRGARVTALIRTGSSRTAAWAHIRPGSVIAVQGSVTDLDLLRRMLEEYAVDTVFHLAAQTLVGAARQDPAATLDINVRGTWTVLEAARAAGGCQVLAASSGKAYGDLHPLPLDEEMPLRGRYPYDVSKSCADLIATMYAHTYGLPAASLRCGNVFGGGDLNLSRTIPGAILATLRGEPFHIRSDGKAARDYLYVEDAAEGYLALAEKMAGDPSVRGQAFNLGQGEKFTVLEIVEMVLRIMGRSDLRPVILAASRDEVPAHYLSVQKARRVFGWRPRFGMEEGLVKSVAWYRDYLRAPEPGRSFPAVAS